MLRRVLGSLFLVLGCLLLVCPAVAGTKSVSRVSSRTQAVSGTYGHFVSIPLGHFEGVAVAQTRREAVNNACYSGDCSKRVVSKTVKRGADGMFHSSVIYRNR